MKKRFLAATAAAVTGVIIFSSTALGAGSIAKNIKAYFSGIKIIVNGKQQASTPEPFIYNNTTYVPIRLVSTALGKNVVWDQQQNAVIISDGAADQQTSAEVTQLKNQLAQKEAENAQLRQQNSYYAGQLVELQSKIKELEKKKDVAGELEDYLEDKYSKWKKIEFEYDVDGDEDELELTIEVDLSDYKSKWVSLDEDDIEDWLNEIYKYVKKEYPDADFYGTIVDVDEDEDLVEFKVSKGKLKVEFNYSIIDTDDIEDDLNDIFGADLYDYDRDFGDMEAYFSVEVNESKGRIYVTIEIDTDEYGDEWDDVKDTDAAEDWIWDIVDLILDYTDDYDVYGEIVDEDDNTLMNFYYYVDDDDIEFDW